MLQKIDVGETELKWMLTHLAIYGQTETPPVTGVDELSAKAVHLMLDRALKVGAAILSTQAAHHRAIERAGRRCDELSAKLDRHRRTTEELEASLRVLEQEWDGAGWWHRRRSSDSHEKELHRLTKGLMTVREWEVAAENKRAVALEDLAAANRAAEQHLLCLHPSAAAASALASESERIENAQWVLELLKTDTSKPALAALRAQVEQTRTNLDDIGAEQPGHLLQEMILSRVELERQRMAQRRAEVVLSREREAAQQAKKDKNQLKSLRTRLESLRRKEAALAASVEGRLGELPQLQQRLARLRGDQDRALRLEVERNGPWKRDQILRNLAQYPVFWTRDQRIRELEEKIDALSAEKVALDDLRRQVEQAAARVSAAVAKLSVGTTSTRKGSPPRRVVLDWRDAEGLACRYMRWFGYADAEMTGNGADGGVDVQSALAVGQVKMHATGVGRPDIQRLYGIAVAEGKTPLMFAMVYSRDGLEWADKHGVLLFQFTRSGRVEPASTGARAALESGHIPKRKPNPRG